MLIPNAFKVKSTAVNGSSSPLLKEDEITTGWCDVSYVITESKVLSFKIDAWFIFSLGHIVLVLTFFMSQQRVIVYYSQNSIIFLLFYSVSVNDQESRI